MSPFEKIRHLSKALSFIWGLRELIQKFSEYLGDWIHLLIKTLLDIYLDTMPGCKKEVGVTFDTIMYVFIINYFIFFIFDPRKHNNKSTLFNHCCDYIVDFKDNMNKRMLKFIKDILKDGDQDLLNNLNHNFRDTIEIIANLASEPNGDKVLKECIFK